VELQTYDEKTGLLRVSWKNRIDMDALQEQLALVALRSSYPRDLKVISTSHLEEVAIPLTQGNLESLCGMCDDALDHYHSARLAIYGLRPVPAAYVSCFSEFWRSSKAVICQFPSEQEAVEWLLA